MSVISGKSSTPSSILKSSSGLSRDRVKDLVTKVRFERPPSRKVQHVLQQVLDDDDVQEYYNFLEFIADDGREDDELLEIVHESRNCISLLNTSFRALVETLAGLKWENRGEKFTEEYKSFIVDLLVAHNKYCAIVISKLVNKFVPSPDSFEHWKLGTPTEELAIELDHVIDLVGRVMNVIPMAFDILLKRLKDSFPYYNQAPEAIGGYIHCLIQLVKQHPIFREDLIGLIITQLNRIDVNISYDVLKDSEELDEDEDAEELALIEGLNFSVREDEMRLPIAEALDIGMTKMFEYVRSEMGKPRAEQEKLVSVLFRSFETDILPTHKSHHVQFVMFYLCHFDTKILNQFVKKLWDNVCNFNIAPGIRQASVGYLASLLARGKFVSIGLIKNMLTELATWAQAYVGRSHTATAALRAHTVFYATCEAIFYIIAFRSCELTSNPASLKHLESLHLQALVVCHLNPLRVCLPSVATIFAGVMQEFQIAYCHSILERNARRKLATIYNNDSQQRPNETLDTFFPFDPYLLKKSGKFIEPLFLAYQGGGDDEELAENGEKRELDADSNDEDDFICDDRKRQKLLDSILRD